MSQFKESSLPTLLTALFQDVKCHFGDVISYRMYVMRKGVLTIWMKDILLLIARCGRQWVVSNQKNEKSFISGMGIESWDLEFVLKDYTQGLEACHEASQNYLLSLFWSHVMDECL